MTPACPELARRLVPLFQLMIGGVWRYISGSDKMASKSDYLISLFERRTRGDLFFL